jgi:alpha/beta hydrolase fold
VTVTAAVLGGVPTAEITIDGIEPRHVILYFHGGVYVLEDAFQVAGLAAQVGRRARAKVISVDYRLAPEHPYPAAVDDALAAYRALLTAAGTGSIERGTDKYDVTVRELAGAERDRIYAEQARRYPGFAEYARQTAGVRTIPVLELKRA